MKLAEALLPLLPAQGGVAAIVGAGGKTSTMYTLASELSERGNRVIATTTTHIWDPRAEQGRRFSRLVLSPELKRGIHYEDIQELTPGECVVVGAISDPESGKLKGVPPARIQAMRRLCDYIVVESDGARGLSIKAPADHEPALPLDADLVVGLIGLDCLGRPMDSRIVHRPELFGPLVHCEPGTPLAPCHILALAQAPDGMFKHAPAQARRAIIFNKADQMDAAARERLIQALAPDLPVDRVLLAALGKPGPEGGVLACHPGGRIPCP